jgi:hypothetical protein
MKTAAMSLLIACTITGRAHAEDFFFPIGDTGISIEHTLVTPNGRWPELSFTIRNLASSPWDLVKVSFYFDVMCNGESQTWSRVFDTSLGWIGDPAYQRLEVVERARASWAVRDLRGVAIPIGETNSNTCKVVSTKALLLAAQNSKTRVEGVAPQKEGVREDGKLGAERIPEIVVPTDDGTFSMRDVQLIGRGVPQFRANAFNGLGHDWKFPVFSITYDGHDQYNTSTLIHKSFTVQGMCQWPKSQECGLLKELDFPLFVVDKYEFKLIGGDRTPTEQEKRLAEEERAKKDEEQSKKEAAEAATRRRLTVERKKKDAEESLRMAEIQAEEDAQAAAQRARVKAACRSIYQTTIDKKQGDLTVRESEQIRACQLLNFYPPE